jgi:uncharacterized C2H2 Zn-finger protein
VAYDSAHLCPCALSTAHRYALARCGACGSICFSVPRFTESRAYVQHQNNVHFLFKTNHRQPQKRCKKTSILKPSKNLIHIAVYFYFATRILNETMRRHWYCGGPSARQAVCGQPLGSHAGIGKQHCGKPQQPPGECQAVGGRAKIDCLLKITYAKTMEK